MSSEKNAIKSYARRLLQQRMGDISEDYFCASWLVDLEYLLWEAVLFAGPDTRFDQISLGPLGIDEIADLRELSKDAGGWFYWDDERDENGRMRGQTFISTEKWKAKYEKHAASKGYKVALPATT